MEWFDFMPNAQALAMLPGALAGLALLHDQPNYAHSLPTKLVEYLAHGVPVVTTPNRTAVELVQRSTGVGPAGSTRFSTRRCGLPRATS